MLAVTPTSQNYISELCREYWHHLHSHNFNFSVCLYVVGLAGTPFVFLWSRSVTSSTFKWILSAVDFFSLTEWINQTFAYIHRALDTNVKIDGFFVYWKGNMEWLFQIHQMRIVSHNHLLYLPHYNDSLDRSTSSGHQVWKRTTRLLYDFIIFR